MWGRWKSAEGASAVEFALLLPLLVMLLIGTMFASSLYNTQTTITQAAREGARFGATLPYPDNVVLPPESWFQQVEARAANTMATDRPLAAGPPTICVRIVIQTATGPQTAQRPSAPAPQCRFQADEGGPTTSGSRVEVYVGRPSELNLVLFSIPVQTRNTSVARYEPTRPA